MKLAANQSDEANLQSLGEAFLQMLSRQDFQTIAKQFGYAMSFGRQPDLAIAADFNAVLLHSKIAASAASYSNHAVCVKYFEPNTSNLFAVVECSLVLSEQHGLAADLIVTTDGVGKFLTLEDLYLVERRP